MLAGQRIQNDTGDRPRCCQFHANDQHCLHLAKSCVTYESQASRVSWRVYYCTAHTPAIDGLLIVESHLLAML
jgi:hypothetical protein